jgi:hypothetical protein
VPSRRMPLLIVVAPGGKRHGDDAKKVPRQAETGVEVDLGATTISPCRGYMWYRADQARFLMP